MKKLLAIFSVAIILLFNTSTVFAVDASTNMAIEIGGLMAGKTEMDLSANGKNLFENETSSVLDVHNFSLSKNSFVLSGEVSYSGSTHAISLQGNLFRTSNLNVVLSAVDSTQNFDVAYFVIEKVNSKTDVFIYD